mgnify:CR=1 FL=1
MTAAKNVAVFYGCSLYNRWLYAIAQREPVMTTIIKQDDLITSVKDALQFISYYHPQDFIQAMSRAYDREENKAAKDAIAQINQNLWQDIQAMPVIGGGN